MYNSACGISIALKFGEKTFLSLHYCKRKFNLICSLLRNEVMPPQRTVAKWDARIRPSFANPVTNVKPKQ